MTNDPLPGATYAEAFKSLLDLFTKAIPPEQVRVDKATAKLPFVKGLTAWRLKRLRNKELEHWVKVVKRNGYDPLKYVQFTNEHPEATAMDSLQAFLIEQALEKK